MPEKMLTPAFLTKIIAVESVNHVLEVVNKFHDMGLLKRAMCHIVVLVPSMRDDKDTDYSDYPNYPIEPKLLYEASLDQANWSHKFDSIAKCKAIQLWHGRNDDRTDCTPHLLFPGDTPWWGGVKRHGIVVACSGFQPHFDKMFSGMVADMCIALAYDKWAQTRADFKDDFLPS